MKKGKIILAVMLGTATCLMTGCVDNMPDMTDEQRELVAEYAAELLLKYSPKYDYKLVDAKEIENIMNSEAVIEEIISETASEQVTEEASSEETTEVKEEAVEENTEAAEKKDTESNEGEDAETDSTLSADDVDIAELLAVDDFSIQYTSYEIVDSYPKNGGGFSVTAPKDRKLLVMHLDILNTTGETKTCDMFEKDPHIKVSVNGSKYKEIMNTLLLNDFSSFVEDIPGSGKSDVVMITSITDEMSENLESVIIQITTAENKRVNITLK